jgi:hypothetical protein
MFASELAHGLVELPDVADIFLGTFSFEVEDRGTGKIIVDIPGLFQPVAQVDVLCIHKVVAVKRPYPGERGPADPETSAGQYG